MQLTPRMAGECVYFFLLAIYRWTGFWIKAFQLNSQGQGRILWGKLSCMIIITKVAKETDLAWKSQSWLLSVLKRDILYKPNWNINFYTFISILSTLTSSFIRINKLWSYRRGSRSFSFFLFPFHFTHFYIKGSGIPREDLSQGLQNFWLKCCPPPILIRYHSIRIFSSLNTYIF